MSQLCEQMPVPFAYAVTELVFRRLVRCYLFPCQCLIISQRQRITACVLEPSRQEIVL